MLQAGRILTTRRSRDFESARPCTSSNRSTICLSLFACHLSPSSTQTYRVTPQVLDMCESTDCRVVARICLLKKQNRAGVPDGQARHQERPGGRSFLRHRARSRARHRGHPGGFRWGILEGPSPSQTGIAPALRFEDGAATARRNASIVFGATTASPGTSDDRTRRFDLIRVSRWPVILAR